MIWNVPKIWQGGDVWILGGGHSIVQQFQIPSDVVQNVLSGMQPVSTYSPFLHPIHDKHVIGVNASFLIGTWIDMVFFGDNHFLIKYEKDLKAFPNVKVSCSRRADRQIWLKYVPMNPEKKLGITTKPNVISWNENSGSAAVNVAVHTGAKRIFLLGFDMKLSENKEQHWHKLYSGAKPPFARHMLGFPEMAKDAKKLGIEIFNVSPDSAITVFPKLTLQEALQWK